MSPVLQHLFPLLLCLTAAWGYTHDGSCTPWCRDTEENIVENGKVADPKSCYNYYTCDNGQITTSFPLQCGEGQYFNAKADEPECVSSDTGCDIANNPPCIPVCRYEASGTIEKLADRDDCTKYYVSDGINTIPTECPGGQYFNGDICQLDPDQCCDPCLFYCGMALTNIADPFDCQKYYFCQAIDPEDGVGYFPDDSDSHSCPSGQFYDQTLKSCEISSDCSQLC